MKRLKCRFCDYTVPAVVVYKNGNTKAGADVLINHVYASHSNKIPRRQRKPPRHGHDQRITADAHGDDTFARPLPLDRIFKP